jgi:hypothetical protein
MPIDDGTQGRKRRPRYPGKNPRRFHEKYKELNPERYASEVQKALASGKTPAGTQILEVASQLMSAGQRVGSWVGSQALPASPNGVHAPPAQASPSWHCDADVHAPPVPTRVWQIAAGCAPASQ